jgi:hypothetical protein
MANENNQNENLNCKSCTGMLVYFDFMKRDRQEPLCMGIVFVIMSFCYKYLKKEKLFVT